MTDATPTNQPPNRQGKWRLGLQDAANIAGILALIVAIPIVTDALKRLSTPATPPDSLPADTAPGADNGVSSSTVATAPQQVINPAKPARSDDHSHSAAEATDHRDGLRAKDAAVQSPTRTEVVDGTQATMRKDPDKVPEGGLRVPIVSWESKQPKPSSTNAPSFAPREATKHPSETALSSRPNAATATAPEHSTATPPLNQEIPRPVVAAASGKTEPAGSSAQATESPQGRDSRADDANPDRAANLVQMCDVLADNPTIPRVLIVMDKSRQPRKESGARAREGKIDPSMRRDFNDAITKSADWRSLSDAASFISLGDRYMAAQDYVEAEPVFDRAARLEPRNFDAQYGHGRALQMLNRLVEAIRAYHRALVINPDHPQCNSNMATTYMQLGEPQNAVSFAERSVQLEPSSGDAHFKLGAVYESAGRYADAVAQYDAAVELMEELSPRVLMNLVNALSQDGRYEEARNTAQVLINLDPSAAAYERLGWAYFRLGDYGRSLSAFRKGVELDSTHWPSLNGVGFNSLNAWLLSGKRDEFAAREAKDAFQLSLRTHPDQPKVRRILTDYQF